jgi:hypothetical protein
MKISEEIKQTIQGVMSKGKQPDITDAKTLVSNMIFLYHTMKASENLISVAITTATNPEVSDYLLHHLEEERNHDEWLKEDLLTIGVDVSKTIIPREAVEMVGSIYYLIYHLNAVALLGYMMVMESFPMNLSIVRYLEGFHGKPLLRTLRYHAEHDIKHGKELEELVDSLSTDEQAIVRQTAFQSAMYFKAALDRYL